MYVKLLSDTVVGYKKTIHMLDLTIICQILSVPTVCCPGDVPQESAMSAMIGSSKKSDGIQRSACIGA